MFNTQRYFEKTGLNEKTNSLTVDHLNEVVSSHLHTFRYSNKALYKQGLKEINERKVKSIELEDVFKKLVEKNKPGYCFQTTELLFAVLNQLGFKVNRHLSKVLNQSMEEVDFNLLKTQLSSHDVLIVLLDDKRYLIDTGFANNSLRHSLPLEEGEHQIREDVYRLCQKEEAWFLEMKVKENQWLCLYQFQDQPSTLTEINTAHREVYLTPNKIPIRDDFLKIAQVTKEKREFIISFKKGDAFFKSYQNGSLVKNEKLEFNQIKTKAEEEFAIECSINL